MRAVLLAALCVLGCGASAPAERSHQVAAARQRPSPQPPAPPKPAQNAEPAVGGPVVRLEPLPVRALSPAQFRVVEPRAGEVLTLAEAEGRSVVLSGALGEVRVALDDHAFRRVSGGKVRLMELLLEDEELAPGPHRVAVVQDATESRSVQWSWFTVSDEASAAAEPPPAGAVLLSPHGTFNGDAAADAVTIDAFALTARRPILVRVFGPGWSVERRSAGEPLGVRNLPSGDFRIEVVELSEAASGVTPPGPWATLSRVITVNRDAPQRPKP